MPASFMCVCEQQRNPHVAPAPVVGQLIKQTATVSLPTGRQYTYHMDMDML